MKTRRMKGFSLVELLLVLAILGIISAIAIPTFLGQRRRARVIGDAQSNARSLMMALESRKAENGIYANAGTYNWTASGATPAASTNPAPAFTPKGNSFMNYSVVVASGGLTYTLTAKDTTISGTPTVLTADETGAITIASGFK